MISSAASVRRRTGASAERATARPSSAAMPTPAQATSSRIQRSRARTSVHLGQRTGDLEREPGARSGTVRMRTCVPATVASEKYAPLRPAATACVRSSTGSATFEPRSRADASVGGHELDVAARRRRGAAAGCVGELRSRGRTGTPIASRTFLERVVDLAAELVRGRRSRRRSTRARRRAPRRRRGRQREPRAERHRSRSA